MMASFAMLFATALPVQAQVQDGKVLSLGGAVTEIVVALGQGDRLVARDSTSTFPPEVLDLPDVGYVRALSPEGVLSVEADLILAEEGAGPPEVIDVIQSADVVFVEVPDGFDGPGIARKIETVGAALGLSERAQVLAGEVADALEAASVPPGDAAPRVLFVLSASGGRIMASGRGTAADAMIALAGGVNAIDAFEGYRQLGDEAVTRAAPDVILMMDREGDHAPGDDALFALPAIAPTPAAQARAVIRMDGLRLLGFGPRTPEAVADLARALHGAGG
nr:ABC transporter substrate-binding protein [Roseobacter sp. HKCCA0434]